MWTGKIRQNSAYIIVGVSMIVENIVMFMQKVMLFTSYINNCSSFPKPLTEEEEKELLIKVEQNDENAKKILVSRNLRLVAHVVKKFKQSEECDDLISVGCLGLIKAINTYKMEHGTLFSTYAARCIENEILMLIRANKKHKNNVSIEDVLGCDDEENEITIGDINYDQGENIEEMVSNEHLSQKLDKLLVECLSKREYQIICLRYGLKGCPMLAQREVASKLGISRSYISRLEKKSLEIIKRNIKKEDFSY